MRAAAVVLLASCANDSGVELADADATQIAMAIASTLRPVAGGGELAAMLDVAALVRGEVPGDLTREDGVVVGRRAGFSVRYTLACRDDHDREVACGARTAHAEIDATWAAVLATSAYVMVSAREGAWVVSDITPDQLQLDGASHLEYASRVVATGEGRTLAYDASHRDIAVVRGERWPRGGLVRYDLAIDRTDARAVDIRAETRFHARGLATIVLPDHVFELDLSTGIVSAAP